MPATDYINVKFTVTDDGFGTDPSKRPWWKKAMDKVTDWCAYFRRKAMNGCKRSLKLLMMFYIIPFMDLMGRIFLAMMGGFYGALMIMCGMGGKWSLVLALLIEFFKVVTIYCLVFWLMIGVIVFGTWAWRKWGQDAMDWMNSTEQPAT